MTYRSWWGARAPRLVSAVGALLLVGACAPGGGEAEAPAGTDAPAEAEASGGPNAEWVLRTVRTLTLERMFAEQDPDPVTVQAGDRPGEVLAEAGVLVEDGNGDENGEGAGEGEGVRVETDPDLWSASLGEGLSGDGPLLQEVDQALADFLRENAVTWCGPEVPGDIFVASYPGAEGGAFATHEEYRADIADYVDCGDGSS
ncbi:MULTISPECIES: hypothetical protein [unclassified Nocardiopsis]|uniref:hypothetical protein n=1 Tax=Nocardiopsis TaxID=2013 RepID=UPI00387AD4AE